MREIAVREEMRKAIENARRKIQRFADLARGAAPAITDHVRSHGCTVFAVASVNFLDHRFATIAAGKIEIDIGPTFPVSFRNRSKTKLLLTGSTGVMPRQ